MADKPISLDNVRRNKEWIENHERISPFYDALQNADQAEAPACLFRLARKHRDLLDEGIGKRSAVLAMLRAEAVLAKIPIDEAEQIIKAGLYRSRKARQ
jgi:hypothetical protein